MENNADNINEVFYVVRSQSGDREALDLLLRSVQTGLWRYISRLVSDQALAEDVLQEVFMIVYRKIGWLNDPKLFRAWVYRIASRECFRYLKKEVRWREQIRDDEILNNVASVEDDPEYDPELTARILEMLERVSPASRAVLILHYLDEYSLNETATILDISTGTVRSRLAYGLAKLRDALGDAT